MVVMTREEVQLRSAFTKLAEQQLGREGNKICIFIPIVIEQYSQCLVTYKERDCKVQKLGSLCIWPLVRGPLPAMWHSRFYHDAIL